MKRDKVEKWEPKYIYVLLKIDETKQRLYLCTLILTHIIFKIILLLRPKMLNLKIPYIEDQNCELPLTLKLFLIDSKIVASIIQADKSNNV